MPGPYIKDFYKAMKNEGLYKLLEAFEDKSAVAQCIIAYIDEEHKDKPLLFPGRTPGCIVKPTGTKGFGWDPIFKPDGSDKSYATMEPEEKNKISHRFRAVTAFGEYLSKK